MASIQPWRMDAGDNAVMRLTFRVDGELIDLDTDVTEIELEVKAAVGDADPALISISMTGGEIVKLAQLGDTLGQADATIASALTLSPAFAPGIYKFDVVAVLTTGGRRHAVKASDFQVDAVVNQT